MLQALLTSRTALIAARVATAACFCLLVVLSLSPAEVMVRTHAPKIVEHFAAYAGTGALSAFGFARSGRPAVLLAAGLVALAGALEYAQRFSPGRESGWDTFIASAVGASVGVAILAAAMRLVAGAPKAAAISR